jgi:hypothetical protein
MDLKLAVKIYTYLWVRAKIYCCDRKGALSKKIQRKNKVIKINILMVTNNGSFSKNWGAKNLGKLLRILQNVIEKSFINWRVLPLVKINTRISSTPCILSQKACY